jgi:hypothetical protein
MNSSSLADVEEAAPREMVPPKWEIPREAPHLPTPPAVRTNLNYDTNVYSHAKKGYR